MKNLLLAIIPIFFMAACSSGNSYSSAIAADTTAAEIDSVAITDTATQDSDTIVLPPLTQYALVEITEHGACLRSPRKIRDILRSIGFAINHYEAQTHRVDDDGEEDFKPITYLRATREAGDGVTEVKYYTDDDYDLYVAINFANEQETQAFVESMKASGYSENKGLFTHPKSNLGKIHVRIKGNTAKIICPFEMAPNDF